MARGVKVEAVCARLSYVGGEKPARKESWQGIRIRRVYEPNWNRKGTALRTLGNLLFVLGVTLFLLFRRRKPDVVFVTTAPPFLPLAARLLKTFRRVPFVYCIYDLEPDRVLGLGVLPASSLFVKMMRRFQGKALRSADRVLAIGRCMAGRLKSGYGLPDSKVAFIPIGADVESLGSKGVKPTSLASRFQVAYSGNFGRYHDFDGILDAARALPDVDFLLVGKGAQRAHVEERVRAEGISNIELKDFLDDDAYAAMLARADVCLVTMEKGLEGTCVPSKFYAYMAAGKPTIAIVDPTCEVALALAEQDCGVAVTQGDSTALAESIRTLLANPSRLTSMSKNAAIAAGGLLSREKSVEAIQALLMDVAAGTLVV